MPVYLLRDELAFPPPEEADMGLLAIGGDLRPERLLLAYSSGIFPWYEEGLPILWHSPDPRCVLRTDGVHVGRSLRRVLRQRGFEVTFDRAFADVIRGCKDADRPGQDGTWITGDMERAYLRLHELGFAHSVEAWHGGALAGGVYGVSLGSMFFGESMFARQRDASKVALVALAERLRGWGFPLIDAQVANPHTVSLGAEDWPRARFLDALRVALVAPTRRGSWSAEDTFELEPAAEAPELGARRTRHTE